MQKSMKKYFAIFVLPTLIAFCIAFVIPFIIGVYLSMAKFTVITKSTFVGLENYVKVFTVDDRFTSALWFTTKFTLISVVTVNIFAFAVALLLSRGLKGTNFFRSVFFMPNLIGGIVLGYIWNLLINGVLGMFGVDITYKAEYGFWGLVILTNWQMIGYMMIIYIAGIQNIPSDVLEAANIDGAKPSQTLFKVKIPMMMSSITICTFLTLSNSFKLFDQNLALTAGAPGYETAGLALDIFNTFYNRSGFEGVAQAKAVLFFILVAVIAFIQLKITRSKEVES